MSAGARKFYYYMQDLCYWRVEELLLPTLSSPHSSAMLRVSLFILLAAVQLAALSKPASLHGGRKLLENTRLNSLSEAKESGVGAVVPATKRATSGQSETDYDLLYDLAELANLCDVSPTKIKRELSISPHKKRVDIRVLQRDLEACGVKYNYIEYVDVERGKKRRVISIRGTKSFKNMQSNMDQTLEYRPQYFPVGMKAHRGYALLSEAILEDFHVGKCGEAMLLTQRSQADDDACPLIITGHSMGGCVSILLALALVNLGVEVESIVTFGMPRFVNAAGSRILVSFPVVQVEHQKDPITQDPPVSLPELPYVDFFTPLQNRLVLLVPEETFLGLRISAHSCLHDDEARGEKTESARRFRFPPPTPDLKYHSMSSYQEILLALNSADKWAKGVYRPE